MPRAATHVTCGLPAGVEALPEPVLLRSVRSLKLDDDETASHGEMAAPRATGSARPHVTPIQLVTPAAAGGLNSGGRAAAVIGGKSTCPTLALEFSSCATGSLAFYPIASAAAAAVAACATAADGFYSPVDRPTEVVSVVPQPNAADFVIRTRDDGSRLPAISTAELARSYVRLDNEAAGGLWR